MIQLPNTRPTHMCSGALCGSVTNEHIQTNNSVQSTVNGAKNQTTISKSTKHTQRTDSTVNNSARPIHPTVTRTKAYQNKYPTLEGANVLGCIMDEEDEPILSTADTIRITSALDSGAVANVVSPECVPSGTMVTPNTTGTHYTGAGGGRITKHGSCTTIISDDQGRRVICPYNLADVSRPLNSVSQIAGPENQPEDESRAEGNDILFSNKRAVVVPPGVVARVMKEMGEAILQWDRAGNLYTKEFNLQYFTRQGVDQ